MQYTYTRCKFSGNLCCSKDIDSIYQQKQYDSSELDSFLIQ